MSTIMRRSTLVRTDTRRLAVVAVGAQLRLLRMNGWTLLWELTVCADPHFATSGRHLDG